MSLFHRVTPHTELLSRPRARGNPAEAESLHLIVLTPGPEVTLGCYLLASA